MAHAANKGKIWLGLLIGGAVLILMGIGFEHLEMPLWLIASCLGLGGLAVIFGSCEVMIKSVDGYAKKNQINTFVAGTMAGLASNIPEVVMLGFILAATPMVGFMVTAFTLHVGVAAFGLYCGFLPRNVQGDATLPAPLVKLSTDLYAAAAAIFFSLGMVMLLMTVFAKEGVESVSLNATDLYVLGAILLIIEVVAVRRLIQRFSNNSDESIPLEVEQTMSYSAIWGFAILGIISAIFGGHAVGEFAEILVNSLTSAGYSQVLGALILSIFASSGAFAMIGAAHFKKQYNIAMASASGAISQVPFVVLPITFILLAVFGQSGITPVLADGGILAINLHTTSVIFLSFPSMLILWKSVQDDGKVNWVETVSMIGLFLFVIYLLVAHG